VIVAVGNTTAPDMEPVAVLPGQNPVRVIGNALAFGESVCVALLHVLPATVTLSAVIVQVPLPILMKALPVVTSTNVVLVAVAVQDALDVTTVGVTPKLFVQLLNVGPASVPAAFTVRARSPCAKTLIVVVHVTVAEPDVRVKVPCPCAIVVCGSQLAAEADEAPISAINIEAAATAVPYFLMLRMLLSFCR
jgi:hypothetical protein